eukprot:COSAG04_NODE_1798_length_5553_cov_4.452695_2_plen_1516_part_00
MASQPQERLGQLPLATKPTLVPSDDVGAAELLVQSINEPGRWDVMLSYTQRNQGSEALAAYIHGEMTAHGKPEIHSGLEKRGKTVWLDVKMKKRDEAAMEEGVRNSRCVWALISGPCVDPANPNSDPADNAYFKRPLCLKELRWAMEAGVHIQPVVAAEDKGRITEFFADISEDLEHLKAIDWIHIDRKDKDYFELGIKKVCEAADLSPVPEMRTVTSDPLSPVKSPSAPPAPDRVYSEQAMASAELEMKIQLDFKEFFAADPDGFRKNFLMEVAQAAVIGGGDDLDPFKEELCDFIRRICRVPAGAEKADEDRVQQVLSKLKDHGCTLSRDFFDVLDSELRTPLPAPSAESAELLAGAGLKPLEQTRLLREVRKQFDAAVLEVSRDHLQITGAREGCIIVTFNISAPSKDTDTLINLPTAKLLDILRNLAEDVSSPLYRGPLLANLDRQTPLKVLRTLAAPGRTAAPSPNLDEKQLVDGKPAHTPESELGPVPTGPAPKPAGRHIFVKTPASSTITVDFDGADTVEQVLAKLAESESFQPDDMWLSGVGGTPHFSPGRTLDQLGVQPDATLELHERRRGGDNAMSGSSSLMNSALDGPDKALHTEPIPPGARNGDGQNGFAVFVKTPTALIMVEVNGNDTVEQLLGRFKGRGGQSRQGRGGQSRPDEMWLSLLGQTQELRSTCTLHELGIRPNTDLQLHERCPGRFRVFVKVPTGSTMTVEVDDTDCIEQVMAKLEEKGGFQPDDVWLAMAGGTPHLSPGRTLKELGIQAGANLELHERNRSGDDGAAKLDGSQFNYEPEPEPEHGFSGLSEHPASDKVREVQMSTQAGPSADFQGLQQELELVIQRKVELEKRAEETARKQEAGESDEQLRIGLPITVDGLGSGVYVGFDGTLAVDLVNFEGVVQKVDLKTTSFVVDVERLLDEDDDYRAQEEKEKELNDEFAKRAKRIMCDALNSPCEEAASASLTAACKDYQSCIAMYLCQNKPLDAKVEGWLRALQVLSTSLNLDQAKQAYTLSCNGVCEFFLDRIGRANDFLDVSGPDAKETYTKLSGQLAEIKNFKRVAKQIDIAIMTPGSTGSDDLALSPATVASSLGGSWPAVQWFERCWCRLAERIDKTALRLQEPEGYDASGYRQHLDALAALPEILGSCLLSKRKKHYQGAVAAATNHLNSLYTEADQILRGQTYDHELSERLGAVQAVSFELEHHLGRTDQHYSNLVATLQGQLKHEYEAVLERLPTLPNSESDVAMSLGLLRVATENMAVHLEDKYDAALQFNELFDDCRAQLTRASTKAFAEVDSGIQDHDFAKVGENMRTARSLANLEPTDEIESIRSLKVDAITKAVDTLIKSSNAIIRTAGTDAAFRHDDFQQLKLTLGQLRQATECLDKVISPESLAKLLSRYSDVCKQLDDATKHMVDRAVGSLEGCPETAVCMIKQLSAMHEHIANNDSARSLAAAFALTEATGREYDAMHFASFCSAWSKTFERHTYTSAGELATKQAIDESTAQKKMAKKTK